MRKVDTSIITPLDLLGTSGLHIYCGLDCCVTSEVLEATERKLDLTTRAIYTFERALQGPVLTMMRRGILIDKVRRLSLINQFEHISSRLERHINRLADAIWKAPLNPQSDDQVKRILYEHMQIPPEFHTVKGERKVTTNEKALEKIAKERFYASPLCEAILAFKENAGYIKVLRSGVDPDDRMRASFNIAGTETGRWSSSKNSFGTGTNFQNITPDMRCIFIADPGYVMAYIDLAQAEARAVAYLSDDEDYIMACESGDLHTLVASMVFNLDPSKVNEVFFRHFTYRDMAKRGAHAANYNATAFTISKNLKIEQKIAEDFLAKYHNRFKGIRRWHREVQIQLQQIGILTTPMGRRRTFFGRRWDDATLREAIAFVPQSVVADVLNRALLTIFQKLEPKGLQLLAQVHDAILFQVPESRLDLIDEALDLMQVPVNIGSRTMTIPSDVKMGYDWRDLKKDLSKASRNTMKLEDMVI